MDDEVATGGGCGVDELKPVVVTEMDEVAGLVNIIGCGARRESLSCHSCCSSLESGQVHVASCKEEMLE